MKVQLIVVQGKPEGKVIPLLSPIFRIGRGENCHLRPNSEQVSREHAEFQISSNGVTLKDLGSRNGTLVNGKALTQIYTLKDRDLVQIGQLTFAVSIEKPAQTPEVSTTAGGPAARPKPKAASPEDVSHDDIESWLVADAANQPPERPSGVYGGETISIAAFKGGNPPKPEEAQPAEAPAPPRAAAPVVAKPAPAPIPAPPAPTPPPAPVAQAAPAPAPRPAPPKPAPAAVSPFDAMDMEYERLPEGMGDQEESGSDSLDSDDSDVEDEPTEEDFVDESNPFYIKKETPKESTPEPAAKSFGDTSSAASEILKKIFEKKRTR